MAIVDLDGQVVATPGGMWQCVRCGGVNRDCAEPIEHEEGCPVAAFKPRSAPGVPVRTSDPNTYVWTSRGMERAMDVERSGSRRQLHGVGTASKPPGPNA